MQYIAPLIQTILWVGLIAGLVWRFNKPLYDLLDAMQDRIRRGSGIKAGPFEMSELKPQPLDAQREKMAAEIHELIDISPSASLEGRSFSADSLQSRYLQAEDMALRAIQAKYGIPISRQVARGADARFDGAFALGGSLYVVEVKYSYHNFSVQTIKTTIERILSIFDRYNWKNTHIMIVLVYEEPPGIGIDFQQLSLIKENYSVPITIEAYSFDELERQFGTGNEIKS